MTLHREALVIRLSDPDALDPARSGTKAANLARLAQAGLVVPPGAIVLPGAVGEWDRAREELAAILADLGSDRFAVRSSAVAEDLAEASFAGQYETELNVRAATVPEAVRRVVSSATAARVGAYRAARAGAADTGTSTVAVLVQAMVDASAAGVAFTADPVTGDRGTVVVTAVRGLGERLVSGTAVPDEWRIRGADASRVGGAEEAVDAAQARAVAVLARRVERELGTPQDIEWAIEDGRLYLLQARPMTALPEHVEWRPPSKGWWLRNFRLGELLSDPVTPLFVDWLLPRLDRGHARATEEDIGVSVEPADAVINGWYYTTPQGRGSPAALLLRLARRPRALVRMYRLLIQPFRDPRKAHGLLSEFARRWREERQPRYAAAVAEAEARIGRMSADELAATIDRVGLLAGEVGWSIESVAGSAWKFESVFARFVRRYVPDPDGGSYQRMLIGLPGTEPVLDGHAVQSVDWYWPTAGERGGMLADAAVLERHRRLREEGDKVARACRDALSHTPALRRRFDELLALAREYAVLRERQTRAFTIAWPLLRRAVLRLGTLAAERAAVERPEDVFFLTRAELLAAVAGTASDPRARIDARRAAWERQRRLAPPLEIGAPPAIARGPISGLVQAARREPPSAGALVGHPASPGRASGRVRIVGGPEEFERFAEGEVLVARATAPAWTPLFGRAAAIVTDGGSLAAHASLVAREFGIPAVVATGDATRRLRDGQRVTVDGGAGVVLVAEGDLRP